MKNKKIWLCKQIWLHGVFKVFSVESPALVNKIKYYMSSFVSSYPLKGAHGNNDNLQFIVVWLVGWFKKAHRLLKTLTWLLFWRKYTNLVLDFFCQSFTWLLVMWCTYFSPKLYVSLWWKSFCFSDCWCESLARFEGHHFSCKWNM